MQANARDIYFKYVDDRKRYFTDPEAKRTISINDIKHYGGNVLAAKPYNIKAAAIARVSRRKLDAASIAAMKAESKARALRETAEKIEDEYNRAINSYISDEYAKIEF